MSTPASSMTATAPSTTLRDSTELLGRILLSGLFLMSGLGKMATYTATAGYMASRGIPGMLLPLVILTEVGGALAIITGWRVRIVAILMAGFTMLTALMFHSDFADQNQMIHFMKNVSIAGAFLMLATNGAGRYGLDARAGR